MARSCSVCAHPARASIDAALRTGAHLRALARQWNCSKDALARHRDNHLTATAPTETLSAPPDLPSTEAPLDINELETAFASTVIGIRAADTRSATFTAPAKTAETSQLECPATTDTQARHVLPAWIKQAVAQAVASANGEPPVVILLHHRTRTEDLAIMRLADFQNLLRARNNEPYSQPEQ